MSGGQWSVFGGAAFAAPFVFRSRMSIIVQQLKKSGDKVGSMSVIAMLRQVREVVAFFRLRARTYNTGMAMAQTTKISMITSDLSHPCNTKARNIAGRNPAWPQNAGVIAIANIAARNID